MHVSLPTNCKTLKLKGLNSVHEIILVKTTFFYPKFINFSPLLLDQGKTYQVEVIPGGTPSAFYIKLVSSQGLLSAIEDDIAAEVKEKESSSPTLLTASSACLVFNQEKDKWFRGIIQSDQEEQFVVSYSNFLKQ